MFGPVSAIMAQAVIRSIPGTLFQVSTAAAKGRIRSSNALLEFHDPFPEFIPVRQPLLQKESMMFFHAFGGNLLQHGDLAAQPFAGQPRQGLRIGFPTHHGT